MIAAVTTGVVVYAISLDGLTPAFLTLAISLYIVAVLSTFQRPATGSIDRAVLLAKVKLGVLGLGALAAAALPALGIGERSKTVPLLLLGGGALVLLIYDGTWRRYRERCRSVRELYRERQEAE